MGRRWQVPNVCHINNLVHAIKLALTKGKGGHAYFVSDAETLTMKDFLSRYVGTQNVQVPPMSIPKPIARTLAWASESVWKIFRRSGRPPLVRFSIDIMSAHCTLNIAKAKADLGYWPVISIEQGFKTMPRL